MSRILRMLLLVALFLSACSPGGTPVAPTIGPVTGSASPSPGGATSSAAPTASSASTGSVVIGFGAQEYERQIYEPLIAAFNRENPGIQVQFVSLDEIMNSGDPAQSYEPNAITRRILSATDTAVTWSISPEAVKYGYLRDLKPLMDADPTFDRDDFFRTGLSAGELDGGSYLLPRVVRVRLLSYNKNLWASRGIPAPKPNWTWNDMLQAAEQLAQKRGNDVQTYGFIDGSAETTALFGELASKGIDLFRMSLDQIKLDQPDFVAALDRTQALVNSGAVYYRPFTPNASPGENPYQQIVQDQQAALWPQDLVYSGPDGPKLPFEVGVVAYPQVNLPAFMGGVDGYIMSSGTQHPNEAWRWLSYLSQQAISYQSGGPDPLGTVQARKSVTEKSGYWSKFDAETTAAVTAALERPTLPPPTSHDGRIFEPLSKAIQAVLTEKQGSLQAMQEAQQALEQMLAQASPSASPSPDTSPIIVELPAPNVAPDGATQITFGSFGGDPMLARRLAREFNQSNSGVFVQIKDMAASAEPLTIASVAAQFDCFSWWSTPDTEELKATLDLKPLIDADPSFNLDDYPAALLAPFQGGIGLHGLPQSASFRVMNYNQTAFAAANLASPSVNWTLQDFVQTAEQLTTGQGERKQYGYVALGGQTGDLMFFITRSGASVIRGSGDTAEPNFLDPKVKQAIQMYLDLLHKASPHTKIGGYSRSDMGEDTYNLVAQGRAGMWFDSGFSFIPVGPDGQPAAWTTATAPLPLNGRPFGPEDLTTRGLHISAQTQHPEACWAWIKHLSEQVGSFDGTFPARKSLVASEAFRSKAPAGAVEVYNAYAPILEQADQRADTPKPFYMSKIEFYWFFRAVDRAFQGEDLDRELAEAQSITEEFVACVQGGVKAATCAKQVDPQYQGFILDEATPLPKG